MWALHSLCTTPFSSPLLSTIKSFTRAKAEIQKTVSSSAPLDSHAVRALLRFVREFDVPVRHGVVAVFTYAESARCDERGWELGEAGVAGVAGCVYGEGRGERVELAAGSAECCGWGLGLSLYVIYSSGTERVYRLEGI